MKRTGSVKRLSLPSVRFSSTVTTQLCLIVCSFCDDIKSPHKYGYLPTAISCGILIIPLIIVYRTNHGALQSRIQRKMKMKVCKLQILTCDRTTVATVLPGECFLFSTRNTHLHADAVLASCRSFGTDCLTLFWYSSPVSRI